MTLCAVIGCDGVSRALGLCRWHYTEFSHQNITHRGSIKKCSIDGCEGKYYGRGLCRPHYSAWRYRQPDEIMRLNQRLNQPGMKEQICMQRKQRWIKLKADPVAYAAFKAKQNTPEFKERRRVYNKNYNSQPQAVERLNRSYDRYYEKRTVAAINRIEAVALRSGLSPESAKAYAADGMVLDARLEQLGLKKKDVII